MTPTEALQEMLTNSDHFFKYYPVKMWGGAPRWIPDAENFRGYYLRREPEGPDDNGGTRKAGHMGATRPGLFSIRTRQVSSFQMMPGPPPAAGPGVLASNNSPQVQTCCVPMVNYNSDIYGCINLNGAIGTMKYYEAGAGANYLTTGELSGCCFTWCEIGGNLRCIHIQPNGPQPSGAAMTGALLQPLVITNGHFSAMPGVALNTYGFANYGMRRSSVIGVRAVGAWRLYAQISTTRLSTIEEVWRIHPAPAVRLL